MTTRLTCVLNLIDLRFKDSAIKSVSLWTPYWLRLAPYQKKPGRMTIGLSASIHTI
jgi:hypothetical protein